MFCQYFETMKKLSDDFEQFASIDEKINYLENLINNAIKNVEQYNSLRIDNPVMKPLVKEHLIDYKHAIEKFKEQNFI